MSGRAPETVRSAAQDAVLRMRRMWPAFRWGDESDPQAAAREYGEALMQINDPEAIRAGTTAAIRMVGGRFPPPVAELLEFVRAEVKRTPLVIPDDPPNRCPECSAQAVEAEVVVDGNGWASCTEGLHRTTWRAA